MRLSRLFAPVAVPQSRIRSGWMLAPAVYLYVAALGQISASAADRTGRLPGMLDRGCAARSG